MKPHHALTFAALSFLLAAGTGHAALSMAAVGEYDSTNNPNTIDRYAPGTSLSAYNTFKSDVASAFTAGMGGVGTFDTGLIGSQSGINITYGTGKTLNISTTVDVNAQTSPNIIAISGTNPNSATPPGNTGGFLFQSSAGQIATYGFGTITGGAPGEYVSQLGFTVLSRNGGGTPTMTATAFFSDGTSATSTVSFTNTLSDQDTFFHFAAPEGKAITSLEIDWGATGDLRRGIDDLAFITAVPEPSALALGALGLLPLLRRRRK